MMAIIVGCPWCVSSCGAGSAADWLMVKLHNCCHVRSGCVMYVCIMIVFDTSALLRLRSYMYIPVHACICIRDGEIGGVMGGSRSRVYGLRVCQQSN